MNLNHSCSNTFYTYFELMKNTFLFIICITSFIALGQSRLDFIMSMGYAIGSKDDYSFANHYKNGFEISEEKLNSCIKNDVFNYFEELKRYDSELKKKMFKEDNNEQYVWYMDSLKKLKSFYETSYEYTLISYSKNSDISNYNIENKTFTINQEIKAFKKNEQMYDALNNVKSGKQSYNKLSFEPIEDIVQKADYSVFMELMGETVYKGNLKTEIKIHNERDALNIENNASIKILILFNRFDSSNGVYKPRKVLFFVNGKIIQTYGTDKTIDNLIVMPIPYAFKLAYTTSFGLGPFSSGNNNTNNNRNEGNPFAGGGGSTGPETEFDSSQGRVRISNLHSRPKTTNDERAKIAFKLTINSEGKVISVSLIKKYTTTTNERLINEVIELIKKEVRYKEKTGEGFETVYYTVTVQPG